MRYYLNTSQTCYYQKNRSKNAGLYVDKRECLYIVEMEVGAAIVENIMEVPQ